MVESRSCRNQRQTRSAESKNPRGATEDTEAFLARPGPPRGAGEPPPLCGESNAPDHASVSAFNRGTHCACVVEFIGSSPAHWCCERFFPLTPALSLGEREALAAFSPIPIASTRCSAGCGVPSPCGNWGFVELAA